MKADLLLLYILVIVNGRPIFVPCPELTSSGFLYSLTPDCQLITAPSVKAEQFQQVNKAALSTGPCEMLPSSGLQHPIIMVSTLKMLERTELPKLHILYHSPNEQKRRIVRVPASAWSSNEINKIPLDSIGNALDFSEGMSKTYDTCTMLENNVIRCFLMRVEDASEVALIWNDFLVGDKNRTINLKDHKIFLPATSLATNVPLAAFTKENGEVDLLVTHLMKWLWRVSGTEERLNLFSQINVPTKVTPASLPHFALPLIASPMGISCAVCDQTADSPDCAHFFTDMGSYSQCLMRLSFKMLVGFIPIKKGGEKRSVRRALKDEKYRYEATTIQFEDSGEDEAHGNNTVIIEPESPVVIHTDVKVLQSQPSNTFAIVIISVIFVAVLVLILIFLLWLLCYFYQYYRQKQEKEKIHKEIERGIPMKQAATKSDVERLMQAVNEAKEIIEKAARHLQQMPPHETDINESVFAQKKLGQAKLENPPSQKDSSRRLKGINNNNDNIVTEKENLGKIKVRVTLKEEPEPESRTSEQSATPDGIDPQRATSQTTWTSIVPQTLEPSFSLQNNSLEFQTEYLPRRNVCQLDRIHGRKPFTGKRRSDVNANKGKKKKSVLGPVK